MNIGFIGVGHMGYGIAKNLLKNNHNLFVIANKKRKPIDKIVSEGATESKTYEDLCNSNLDVMFLCVTNTPIAKLISEKISNFLPKTILIIDITTHNQNGSKDMDKIFAKKNIFVCYLSSMAIYNKKSLYGNLRLLAEKNILNIAKKIIKF